MFLHNIVATTRDILQARKKKVPQGELERLIAGCDGPRSLEDALRGPDLSLIAEIKRASPSKGPLHPHLDPASLAQSYARGGAAAISVLTEPAFFMGSFADLEAAREATSLPILCKEFILDPYQVYEARAHGADAILLIAAILSREELAALQGLAHQLGLSALVEVNHELELERALAARPRLVGINNRDLTDFTVDLGTTLRLRPLIPPEVIVVSESGIKSSDDAQLLRSAGVDAVLIGEALVTSPDPEAKIREILHS